MTLRTSGRSGGDGRSARDCEELAHVAERERVGGALHGREENGKRALWCFVDGEDFIRRCKLVVSAKTDPARVTRDAWSLTSIGCAAIVKAMVLIFSTRT